MTEKSALSRIGVNGDEILIGTWDAPPRFRHSLADLAKAPRVPAELYEFCGARALEERAEVYARRLRKSSHFRPYSLAGGQAILSQTIPLNSFAINLAPVLKRYFSSETLVDNDEILTKGYVSSEETTKYDALLETFLRDSLQERRDQWALNLEPTAKTERNFADQIARFSTAHDPEGHLQLVIGGVGSGKSIFIRRFQRHLIPPNLRVRTRWAFLDFNSAPIIGDGTERWVCEEFLESLQKANPDFDLYSIDNMERIFAPQLAKRERSVYARLRKAAPQQYEIERSRDLRMWSDDLPNFVSQVCRFFEADVGHTVVVVFDNVDRLSKDEQIKIFSVAQWFKSLARSFCILQLRDETYERYKNEKPLDTYRTAVRFYIKPPRFVDVIKKRVQLAEDYIRKALPKELSYTLEDGKTISYDRDTLAEFLNRLYMEIFQTQRNSARIVESLAGKDTRRSLETFSRVITSGHLSALSITSIAAGGAADPVRERDIIKILMRTDYRFFSENSGAIRSIFICENDWDRPTVLLAIEILNYLVDKRRLIGEIGLQGYFAVSRLQTDLEVVGFTRGDILRCVERLLAAGLLVADQLQVRQLTAAHTVKVHASGFMHLRILCERLEYLYGSLTIFPFRDRSRCDRVAQVILREARGELTTRSKVGAVRELRDQLEDDIEQHTKSYSVFRSDLRGSMAVFERVNRAIEIAPSVERRRKIELI